MSAWVWRSILTYALLPVWKSLNLRFILPRYLEMGDEHHIKAPYPDIFHAQICVSSDSKQHANQRRKTANITALHFTVYVVL